MTGPAAGTAFLPQKERNPLSQCGGDTAEDPGSGRGLCWWGLGTRLAMADAPRCLSSGSIPVCRDALRSHVGPRCHGERPPVRVQGNEPLPEERLPCCGETLTTTTKRLREMSEIAEPPQEIADTDELPTVPLPVVPSRVPSPEIRKNPSEIKLPPWLGKWGTGSEEKSPTTLPALAPAPPTPAEKPSQAVPQRSRVTHDWQKEVVVDPLDSRPRKDLGSEDLQRGYDGLPIHQFLSSLTDSSPPKDCPPLRAVLLGQGQRKATLASMLYEKYSKETEEEIRPCPKCMESISTTHHDYRALGFQSTPQPITQRHDYLTEQPTSFWMEQARGLPGVTAFFGRNIPFKRNADFSTPITMYLGHPEPFNLCNPYDPLSRQLQPHK
ncbi:sperm-associated antigen 8 isoform X2 [Molothrus ater]|uniref:sperm-associated antigen 8 isoform X2 n=1 Tax=Molothrus ater TaxID=84834 RepID=UPI00174B9184|nr:sperm-associated antigen 8 isoform X2 [Molothrus ater]